MGCFNPAGALGIDVSSSHVGFVNHPIYTLFEVIRPAFAVAFYWIVRPAEENSKIKGLVQPAAKLVSEFLGKPMLVFTVGLNVLNGSTADAFSSAASLRCMIIALGTVSGAHFNPAAIVASMCAPPQQVVRCKRAQT